MVIFHFVIVRKMMYWFGPIRLTIGLVNHARFSWFAKLRSERDHTAIPCYLILLSCMEMCAVDKGNRWDCHISGQIPAVPTEVSFRGAYWYEYIRE